MMPAEEQSAVSTCLSCTLYMLRSDKRGDMWACRPYPDVVYTFVEDEQLHGRAAQA